MALIDSARADVPVGEPIMSERELEVFVSAFETSGFTSSINWYRNWYLLADVDPIIRQPALMIFGDNDAVPRTPNLASLVPDVEVVELHCGHWIQQERPDEVNRVILDWLSRQSSTVDLVVGRAGLEPATNGL